MTGSETVILTMVTPKGVSLVQALAFRQAEGLYEAAISSLEVCGWQACASLTFCLDAFLGRL